jgi:maleylpyruvate isomerase
VSDGIDTRVAPLRASTAAVIAALDAVDDDAVRRASALPGWSVGHVLTHLARNADGNRRMLDGAARGETLDQYPHGAEGRAADIEAGAPRRADEIVADVRSSAAALAQVIDAMPAAAWDHPVRSFAGEYPARDVLLSRRREVEVHHVDLALGYRAADWPADFVALELSRAVAGLERRLPAGTALRLVATDGGGPWEVGLGPASLAVSGPSFWILAWLLGRPVPSGTLGAPAGLPTLRAWA